MNEQQITLSDIRGEVPNRFPDNVSEYRIAIIGEAPGETEVETGIPFSGASGNLLNVLLGNAGITRDCCFVGNVCQIRPPANNIKAFKFDGPEIQSGLKQLQKDLMEFQPNLCLLLGNTAMLAATGEDRKVTDWRGSLFVCNRLDSPMYGYKCMATFHPALLLHMRSDAKDLKGSNSLYSRPLLMFDLKRARAEGLSSQLILPQRNLRIDLNAEELVHWMDTVNEFYPTTRELSVDIEGTIQTSMPCLSLSVDPLESILVPFGHFPIEEEMSIWRSLARLLQNPSIPKCLQNSLYDWFVLAYKYKVLIRNVKNDTMLKTWEIYSELPKSLALQTSIFTREPFYKFERKVDDRDTRHRYCCKDSAVTLEISRAQDQLLKGPALDHYRFNMDLLPALLYMQLRGWNFDGDLARQETTRVRIAMDESLSRINTHAGYAINPRSTQQCAKFLYQIKGLPTQYKKVGGRFAQHK